MPATLDAPDADSRPTVRRDPADPRRVVAVTALDTWVHLDVPTGRLVVGEERFAVKSADGSPLVVTREG